ncbi:hypothetical protein HNR19_003145 [Nocardioides thalensis]|uniref:EthD domain-containing protein n=1 Tax=Nocardioides thalensis TaxID=1914755 RepID=A0A853C5A7_9ACTN|nr:hypothetical protein [Nocardioides thalensis]
MPKLILALHGADLADLADMLVSPAFRHRLAEAGATAVQVNIDDEAVAPALRFGPGEPVTAVVSVWTDRDPLTAIAAVVDAADEPDLHAWRVTEKVRLDPLPAPDGERADVYAQVALLRRPDSMSREDYLTYWQVHHTPIAIRTQNTCGYIQNIVEEALTPSTPEVAAIVEEHFPMAALTDPHEFYGSRGDDAELNRRMTELMDSVGRFGAGDGLDVVPTSRYFWAL